MGGLISVVCVAKRVFGDRCGVWRRFRFASPAEALCWRQVAHCVVLLSLCRDWRATEIRCLRPACRSCRLKGRDTSSLSANNPAIVIQFSYYFVFGHELILAG